MGFHEDTLSSVVLLHALSSTEDTARILDKCKEDLISNLYAPNDIFCLFDCGKIWTASSDGLVRAPRSMLFSSDPSEVESCSQRYFAHGAHESLAGFLHVVRAHVQHTNSLTTVQLRYVGQPSTEQPEQPYSPSDLDATQIWGDAMGFKAIIMTHSSIHTNIASLVSLIFLSQTIQVHIPQFKLDAIMLTVTAGVQSWHVQFRETAGDNSSIILRGLSTRTPSHPV